MDWKNLIVNVVAIFVGLTIYIFLMRSEWGKKHNDIQFAIMLFTVLLACLIGGVVRGLLTYSGII